MSMVSEDFVLRIDGGKLQFSVHAALNTYVDTRTSVLEGSHVCTRLYPYVLDSLFMQEELW